MRERWIDIKDKRVEFKLTYHSRQYTRERFIYLFIYLFIWWAWKCIFSAVKVNYKSSGTMFRYYKKCYAKKMYTAL